MSTADIMCRTCGWRNPAWARVCGGCGGSLASAVTEPLTPHDGATSAQTHAYRPLDSATAAGSATTRAAAPGYEMPPPISLSASSAGPPVPWPAKESSRDGNSGAHRGVGQRGLLAVLIALLVLAGAGAGVWAFGIRPAIHNQVDGTLRTALANIISQIPRNAPPNEYAVSADTVNANIQNQIPAGSGVSSAEVHFQNGYVVLTYTYQGSQGTVTTQMVPVDGRLVARNTTVTGILGLVESGDEVEAALNDELPSIPTSYRITALRTENDTLYVKVNE